MFQRAERRKAKARIGLCGPAGSGKTYSALQLAFGLAPNGKVAIIDTEHGSAELYADLGEYDCATIEPPYTVEKYLELIKHAGKEYDVVVIDSLTHAWAGDGGLLDQQNKKAAAMKNSYTAWRDITPMHNALVDSMLQSPAHIIATMRSKTEYILEEDSRGKKVPRKVGMAPVQREGMDYEMTIVFDIEQSQHVATTSKDRTDLFNGFTDVLSVECGDKIRAWLEGGSSEPAPEPVEQPAETTNNFKFLTAVKEQKERVGDEAYYGALGSIGFERSNHIIEREAQEKFYAVLKELPDA